MWRMAREVNVPALICAGCQVGRQVSMVHVEGRRRNSYM